MSDDKYDVGYGKPPEHTRFVKGKSGNPRGRPRKDSNGMVPIEQVFSEVCGRMAFAGEERQVSGREAMYLGLIQAAIHGNVKAAVALFQEEADLQDAAQWEGELEKARRPSRLFIVPSMPSLEEWEAVAMPMQAKLLRELRDDTHGRSPP